MTPLEKSGLACTGILVILCIATWWELERTRSELVSLAEENMKLNDSLSQFEMYYSETYESDFDIDNGILGLAFVDDGFIAVWTRGRTITEVLETCTHEYAHNNLGLYDKKDVRCS